MEGGIAVFLLLIIIVVAAIVGIALYLTGGALWFGKTSTKGDRIEGTTEGERFGRPEHKTVTSKTIENTELAGKHED